MNIIKKHTTSKGNELEFVTFDHLDSNCLVVIDKSCQLERMYQIDTIGTLEFEFVQIESFEQVIKSWVNEKTWF